MDSILNKLNKLPSSAKDTLSSPRILSLLGDLDKKYSTQAVMEFLMVYLGDIKLADLPLYLKNKYDLSYEAISEVVAVFEDIIKSLPAAVADKAEEIKKVEPVKITEDAAVAGKDAKMVFSSTDEQEVKAMPVFDHQGPSIDDYDAQAKVIIKDFGFKDSDEVVMKRLQNFIIAKLRDVRDDIELLEVLTKSRKIGGMEFDEQKARFLIKLINDKEENFRNGNFKPDAAAEVKKIIFPVFAETEEKKKPAETKPISLEEKKQKDGFVDLSLPRQTGDDSVAGKTKAVEAEGVEDILQLEDNEPSKPENFKINKQQNYPAAAKTATAKKAEAVVEEEKKLEKSVIGDQDAKQRKFGDLPGASEVFPVIEEEDGLPVIRMPEEAMVKPKILPLKPKEIEPVRPEVVVEKPEPVSADSHITIKPFNTETVDGIRQETGINKTSAVFKSPGNLPPAKPEPYIASAKTLPPKTSTMSIKRPSLDDVKFVRKLVGPVEELETMTIIDFRRISPNPQEAAKKIKEKIHLLEKELYTKRAEGIVAWNKNEINRFYRLLGQTAMADGKSIEQVIVERLQTGKPTLTMEEFNAVMELNRELRY